MTYANLDDELCLESWTAASHPRRWRRKVIHCAVATWYEGIDKATWKALTRQEYREQGFGSVALVWLLVEIIIKVLLYWLMNRENRERFLQLRGE
jgi:hypothetical protein